MTCDYEVGYCCRHELENSRHVLEMTRTLVMNKDTSMDQQQSFVQWVCVRITVHSKTCLKSASGSLKLLIAWSNIVTIF